MIQVRQGVFETNSSSTHSITMCTKNEFNEWVDGKITTRQLSLSSRLNIMSR